MNPPDIPTASDALEPNHEQDHSAVRTSRAEVLAAPASVALDRFQDIVSGDFDNEEKEQAPLVPKRVLSAQPESPKLHKVLAQAGFGSRLEMEQLILEGRISVNLEPAHIGQRIQFGDTVKVNGKPIRLRIEPPPPRVIAYHKPAGEVVTHDDPHNRPTVFRRLPKIFQGKWQSVGRLDLNTEGLLLLTNSGGLANRLMHPRFGLEREYAVRVLGALNQEEKQRLLQGVMLDDGMAHFGTLEAGGGEGANCWYRVTISEGRNREVRRMFESVGHAVSRLIRIRYGTVLLPRGLKRGAFTELDAHDILALTQTLGRLEAPSESLEQPRRNNGNRPRQNKNAAYPSKRRGPSQANRSFENGTSPSRRQTSKTNANAGFVRTTLSARQDGDFSAPVDGNASNTSNRNQRQGKNRAGSPQAGPNPGMGRAKTPLGRNTNAQPNKRGASNTKGENFTDRQPDPMKTSFGYIGADSFTKQRPSQGGRRNGSVPKNGGRSGGRGGRG